MTAPGEDPRGSLPPPGDIRPVVAVPRSGLSGVAIGMIFAGLAVLLFFALDARRGALTAPERTRPAPAAATAACPHSQRRNGHAWEIPNECFLFFGSCCYCEMPREIGFARCSAPHLSAPNK